MNRLKAIAGGQPLRSNDWGFIQDATSETIKNLVIGLKGTAGACIISGLAVTYDSTHIYIAEGVIFDGEELCYVPGSSFVIVGGTGDSMVGTYLVYLSQNITTGESRTFKDTTVHNVYQYGRYSLGYAESVPSGGIALAGLDYILNIISNFVIAAMPPIPAGVDLMYVRKVFTADTLDQAQIVVPKPGAGKVTKVISMSARVVPGSTHLEVGTQNLNVMYGIDVTEVGIGSFPNNFIEATTPTNYDMAPAPGQIYENAYVCIGLSGETAPISGSGEIIVYCLYKIITL